MMEKKNGIEIMSRKNNITVRIRVINVDEGRFRNGLV